MTHITHSDRSALHVTLDDIIDSHGLWPVLRALLARPFRREPPLPPLGLNAHLRRDLGLEPLDDGGPPWVRLR
jgi:hypothetical protein